MRRRVSWSLVCMVIGMLGVTALARADEVVTADGSTIVGTVIEISEGKVTIETTFAGTIEIPMESVVSITTTERREIELESGDRLIGTLETRDGEQRVVGPAVGDLSVQTEDIQNVWDEGGESPEERATREALEAYRQPWSGRFELGFDGATGNSERVGLRARAEARRETEFERLLLYSRIRFARENGNRSENEIIGGARLERDVAERVFVYGRGELEFDEFENLDLRATITGGVGFHIVKREEQNLKVRVGGGYLHETFDDSTSKDTGLIELAYEYDLKINDWLGLTHSLTYLPELEDFANDYRLLVSTAFEVPLTNDKEWKLRLGMDNDYNNSPQAGSERLDTTYFINLVYNW